VFPLQCPQGKDSDRVAAWNRDGIFLIASSDRSHAVIDRVDPLSGKRSPWRTLTNQERVGIERPFGTSPVITDADTYAFGLLQVLSELLVVPQFPLQSRDERIRPSPRGWSLQLLGWHRRISSTTRQYLERTRANFGRMTSLADLVRLPVNVIDASSQLFWSRAVGAPAAGLQRPSMGA
jgi:hypothetical protein